MLNHNLLSFIYIDCYDNNPSDMPLVNAKEQTLLWQQNSYLVDSGIHSGASSHVSYNS